MGMPTEGIEFASGADWRSWLETHHAERSEVWLVIHKVNFGHLGIGLEEAVNQALCFGWIDGTLRRRDEQTYFLRFSPRRAQSVWSIRNVRRAERLILEGTMIFFLFGLLEQLFGLVVISQVVLYFRRQIIGGQAFF